MDLKNLAFPIRAYLDLTDERCNFDTLSLCEDLIASRVLSLHIANAGISLDNTIRILERLRDEQIAVFLSVSPECLNAYAQETLKKFKIRGLFLAAVSYNEAESALRDRGAGIVHRSDFFESNHYPMLSFDISSKNFMDLPDVIALCARLGVRRVIVPIQRLMMKQEPFYLREDQKKELAAKSERMTSGNVVLEIHDPFLWRIFNPSKRPPESGCQAANSLFHISAAGDICPCPSMPLKLGRVGESSLTEIFSSARKKELRKQLGSPPSECLGCEEVYGCGGGCRGRSYIIKESFSFRDPACL